MTKPSAFRARFALLAALAATLAPAAAAVDCSQYKIWSTNAYPSNLAGSTDVSLTGSPSGCTHSWVTASSASWLSVTPATGNGSALLKISWTQNNGAARTGTISITPEYFGTLVFTVTQDAGTGAACTSWAISPTSASAAATAGSQAVAVTGSPAGCAGSWSTSSAVSWLSVTPASGSGTASATVSWTQNTGAARSGNVTIAGKSFSVSQAAASAATCTPDANALCLFGSRFRVTATYSDYGGGTGTGKAVPLTSDTGYFWFFTSANVEVVVKIVPFCGSGGSNSVAVYGAGLTDLGITVTVVDTKTGASKSYTNPLGTAFKLIRDGPFVCLSSREAEEGDPAPFFWSELPDED